MQAPRFSATDEQRLMATLWASQVKDDPLTFVRMAFPWGKAGTPLEHHPRVPLVRQNRLYQASFLLRDYGFGLEELPFDPSGNLPAEADPKLVWAQANLAARPVEVNRAPREELLRVPGLGPRTVEAILKARQVRTLRALSSLRKLGVQPSRAAEFILLDGHRPAVQKALW